MRLKLGDLYVKSFNIDSCDNEVSIGFTSELDYAKECHILTKRLIELSLQCTLTEEIEGTEEAKDIEESE